MIAGPLRRCRKVLPVIIFFTTIVIVVIWRLVKLNKQNDIHQTHVFRYNNQEEYIDKHGIKVVVGHYVGNPVNKIPNATYDMVNKVNFNPIPDKGKNGNPVVIEPKDLLVMQQLFQINRFNLLASDQIPLNRSLPDYRRRKCVAQFKDYATYPKTSIIIVFHNEAWSTLLRTIWSAINRSPKELIEEVILVDDASERDFLRKPLEDYIQNFPVVVRILRSKTRVGLIKARLMGASDANGEVLTFLDAHCECTIGWLESLLAVIKNDRKTVACPVIDIINDDTFAYVKSFELHWGAFNWNLQFRWYTLGTTEMKQRKKDYGNAGGKIQIAPCSRVGHIFRKSSPYSFPDGINKTLFSNLARVALVWLDDWANFYFKFNELARNVKDELNVTSRIQLRNKLQCKSFGWYLDNIWPQNFFPKEDRFFGRIRNVRENMCLIRPVKKIMSNQPMGVATLERCLGDDNSLEMFVMTKDGFIMSDDSLCLDAPERPGIGPLVVRIMACSGYSRQKWEYDKKTKELRHVSNHKCLNTSGSKKTTEGLIIADCNGKKSQQWTLEDVPWK
ncbi:hypothetical protein NQ317_006649 [Molorchus minor]|uniref:Polypeptide N-acetylgalactosaminyltransferase n=1 Tax=Molorchus minor TaxID=1323400 RepID=A0ABQ9J6L9_9CUCU|nr:hypothetical protein NQ317_006649 [Molorchus minor]